MCFLTNISGSNCICHYLHIFLASHAHFNLLSPKFFPLVFPPPYKHATLSFPISGSTCTLLLCMTSKEQYSNKKHISSTMSNSCPHGDNGKQIVLWRPHTPLFSNVPLIHFIDKSHMDVNKLLSSTPVAFSIQSADRSMINRWKELGGMP